MPDAADRSFGIIPIKRSKKGVAFLLIQHLNGNWGFPKGRPEAGETAMETAIRECREEVGLSQLTLLSSEPICEEFSYQKQRGEAVNRQIEYFLAEAQDEDVQIQTAEIKAYAWLPYREALRRLGHAEGRETLRQAGLRLARQAGRLE